MRPLNPDQSSIFWFEGYQDTSTLPRKRQLFQNGFFMIFEVADPHHVYQTHFVCAITGITLLARRIKMCIYFLKGTCGKTRHKLCKHSSLRTPWPQKPQKTYFTIYMKKQFLKCCHFQLTSTDTWWIFHFFPFTIKLYEASIPITTLLDWSCT